MNKGDITMKKSTIAIMFSLGLVIPFGAVNAAPSAEVQVKAAAAKQAGQAKAATVRQNEGATAEDTTAEETTTEGATMDQLISDIDRMLQQYL